MKIRSTAALLSILATGAAQAQATWYARATSNLWNTASNWNSDPGGAGSTPSALPASGDTDTWVVDVSANRTFWNANDIVWQGGTTIVDGVNNTEDEIYHNGNPITFRDVELRGGDNPANDEPASSKNAATLNMDNNNSNKIIGDTLTIAGGNTGTLGIERARGTVAFADYTGSGDMLVSGWDNGHQWRGVGFRGPLTFVDGGDFSTFTGTIHFEKVKAGFAYDITPASFDMTITKESQFVLTSGVNVKVKSLLVGPDFVAANPGTPYSYSDFTPAQQAYFDNQGGTIEVTVAGTVGLPALTQGAAESIDETIASIPGVVTESGGQTPTLTVYYDTEDGGTNTTPGPGGWDFSEVVGPAFGPFYANLTGLTNNTTYFYRCKVNNSAGDVWAASSGSFTTGTVPDPVLTAGNGNITNSPTWTGSPPVPTSGTADTKTWRIVHPNVDRGINPATFAGETLEIGDGSGIGSTANYRLRLEPGSGTLTVRDVVLTSNGTIWQDQDNNTLTGDTLTFEEGGYIAPDRIGSSSQSLALNFNDYAGTGTVYIYGNNDSGDNSTVFQTTNLTPGTAMQGFTGTIHRDVLSGTGGCIRWDFSVTEATFKIKLADTDSDLPPFVGNEGASDTLGVNGKMFLTNGVDVKVTELWLYDEAADGSVVLNVKLPDGTYTMDTGTNPLATHLNNVGGNDYSRFFKGGSGTVTVDSGSAGSPFETWAATGTMGAVTWEGDTNGDGVQDGMAFLLGAGNPDDNANGLLPTASDDGSGGLMLTFSMLNAASRGPSASMATQHSSDLGNTDAWDALGNQETVPEGPGTGIVVGVVSFDVSVNGSNANLNDVVATIPNTEGAGGKLFGRLKATE